MKHLNYCWSSFTIMEMLKNFEISSTPVKMVKFNKQLTTNASEVVEKEDSPFSLLVGKHVVATITLEIIVEYPQKNKSTTWPTHATPCISPKDSTSYFKDICSAVFTATLFTIAFKDFDLWNINSERKCMACLFWFWVTSLNIIFSRSIYPP